MPENSRPYKLGDIIGFTDWDGKIVTGTFAGYQHPDPNYPYKELNNVDRCWAHWRGRDKVTYMDLDSVFLVQSKSPFTDKDYDEIFI